jgi:hypothetical protein
MHRCHGRDDRHRFQPEPRHPHLSASSSSYSATADRSAKSVDRCRHAGGKCRQRAGVQDAARQGSPTHEQPTGSHPPSPPSRPLAGVSASTGSDPWNAWNVWGGGGEQAEEGPSLIADDWKRGLTLVMKEGVETIIGGHVDRLMSHLADCNIQGTHHFLFIYIYLFN